MLSRVSVCVSVCALAALAAGASADNHGPGKFAKGEGEEGANRYTFGNYAMEIKGSSGRMVLGGAPNPNKDRNKVKILFDAIKELDSNFAVVGTSGSEKHSVNNFASQEFTIAEPVETNYDGVDCHKIAFESTLNQNSKLAVNTYIFNAAGNITNGDEDNLVDAGNVKFTISVKDWNWCDASATQGDVNYCKKGGTVQAGEWLDFDLTMSTKTKPVRNTSDDAPSARRLNGPGPGPRPRGDQTKRPKSKGGRRKPERFQVGGGVNIDFSTKVQVDGVWEDMYEGYPKMVATAAKTTFTFRFPKSSNIFYDPTIVLAETDEEDSAAGTSTSSMVVTALAAVAVAAAARIED